MGFRRTTRTPLIFSIAEMPLSILSIARFIYRQQIDVIIDYMELRHLYLFPTYLIAKGLLGRKMIYWGQGRDLLDVEARIKNLAYATEQAMCDAIILYAEHLKKYVPKHFHKKVFIANNTLYLNYPGLPPGVTRRRFWRNMALKQKRILSAWDVCRRRKRLDNLVEALAYMNRPDIGLITCWPGSRGSSGQYKGDNIYKLGPIYGDKKFDLLSSADVYCLPGAVGLSISRCVPLRSPFCDRRRR